MLEKQAYAIIKRFEDKKKDSRIMRCENLLGVGVPDINACFNGVEIWIELKCPKVHKRANTPLFGSSHKVMPPQIAWLRHQAMAGGNGAVLITNESLSLVLDGAYINSSVNTATVDQILDKEEGVVFYAKQPLSEVWPDIRNEIEVYYGFH